MSTTEPNQPPAPAPVSKGVPASVSCAVHNAIAPYTSGNIHMNHQAFAALHKRIVEALAPLWPSAEAAQRVATGETHDNYPNLSAITNGTISGRFSEWPLIKPEAQRALARIAELERDNVKLIEMGAALEAELVAAQAQVTKLWAGADKAQNDRIAELEGLLNQAAADFTNGKECATAGALAGLRSALTTAQDALHEKEVYCGQLLCELTTAQSAAAAAERERDQIKNNPEWCYLNLPVHHKFVRLKMDDACDHITQVNRRPPAVAQKSEAGDDMTVAERLAAALAEIERFKSIEKSANAHHGKDGQKLVVPTDAAGRAIYWRARAKSAEGQLDSELSSRKPPSASSSVAVEHGRLVELDRVETGVVRFANDWPGVFIRGDSCFGFAMALQQRGHPIFDAQVKALEELLLSSNAHTGAKPTEIQRALTSAPTSATPHAKASEDAKE